MYASVKWLNDYLDPPADAEAQAELLTRAGFPLEGRETIDDDVCQDFEMTSNRGDCVSHLGMAREAAAISGRTLKLPEPDLSKPGLSTGGPAAADSIAVINNETGLCPLYTGRVIKGVKVGPSPKWIADRLRAIHQIPRNNIVDAANFVLFEFGQPTHVFDLATLGGSQIIIRMANAGEPFLPIGEGEKEVKLSAQDLVIADADRAVAIAGVKGGALTAVTEGTTDILIEAATFNPVAVRHTSRRHNIHSDSCYRFERGVHPAQIEGAADRLVQLILETAGGTLLEGVVFDGAPIPEKRSVSMRISRCRKILGVDISADDMVTWLSKLDFQAALDGDVINCIVPIRRLDIEREIDLIEEVGRMFGHDNIPIEDMIEIRVAPPQPTELAHRAVSDALVGMGYVETVTHSLIGDKAAEAFTRPGSGSLRLAGDQSRGEDVLRSSLLPSLLRVRKHNLDNGVRTLQLFESASTFAGGDEHKDQQRVALLADIEDPDLGLRPMRGVVDRLVQLLKGPEACVTIEADDSLPWLQPGAAVSIGGEHLGHIGVVNAKLAKEFDIDVPMLAAELDLPALYEAYPPETESHALPAFPAIERDISAIVDDGATWDSICAAVHGSSPAMLEAVEFVTTFRGKQVGGGRKSVTLRLRFRAPDRTLTHEEVDGPVDGVLEALKQALSAEIRT